MLITRKSRQNIPFMAIIFNIVSLLIIKAAVSEEPYHLTILHTNDIHGQFNPLKATGIEGEPEIGGFEALSYYVARERSGVENSLLLDAGDLMTGSVICEFEYENAYGGALIAMMNRIGYDGMVPGNHEFDISADNLRALNKIAEFPIICANMYKGDESITDKLFEIYDFGDFRVGVIGLTYYPMRGMAADPNLEGFDTLEPVHVADSLAAELDPVTDVIIILSHLGLDEDRLLADSVTGIDLIVGGHSHTELFEPEIVNGVIMVQAGSQCRYLGKLNISIEKDSIVGFQDELIPMLTEDMDPDPEISRMVSENNQMIDDLYGKEIGKLKDKWEIEYGNQSVLGEWIADALKKRLHTDLAIVNAGSIRRGLGPGKITIRDIYEMLPFDNDIVTFGCSGRQLRTIAGENLSLGAEGFIYPLYISGLTCSWRESDSGAVIIELAVNGEPVKDDQVYQVASLDYIVLYNSKRYLGFDVRAYIKTSNKFPQVVIDEAEKNEISSSAIKSGFTKIK